MTFGALLPCYCEAVLAALGHLLLSVTWENENDLSLLIPCTQLEELEIKSFKEPKKILTDFLPNLKKLVVNGGCLGAFMRTFETFRPSLTHVRLNCAHFGKNGSLFKWEDLPLLWPNLENFSLEKHSKSLPLYKVRDIFTQFRHLKSLNLPIEPRRYTDFSLEAFSVQQEAHPTESEILDDDNALFAKLLCHYGTRQNPIIPIVRRWEEELRVREILILMFWELPSPVELKFQMEGSFRVRCLV